MQIVLSCLVSHAIYFHFSAAISAGVKPGAAGRPGPILTRRLPLVVEEKLDLISYPVCIFDLCYKNFT